MLPCAELVELERELIGTRPEPVGATGRQIPIRRDPMAGRVDELAELLRPVPIVWLEGEPGAGKTMLLAEMADRLTAERGSVVIYAACPRLLGSGTRLMASLAAAVRPRAGPADTTSDDLSMLLDEPAAHDEPVHPDLDVRRTQWSVVSPRC